MVGGLPAFAGPTPIAADALSTIKVGDNSGNGYSAPTYTSNSFGAVSYMNGAAGGSTQSSYGNRPAVSAIAVTGGGSFFTNATATSVVTYQFSADCPSCSSGDTVSVDITSGVAASLDLHGANPAIIPSAIPGGPHITAQVTYGVDGGSAPTTLDMLTISLLSGLARHSSTENVAGLPPAYDGTLYSIADDTNTVSILANTLYDITITASAAVAQGEDGYAYADPVVTLTAGQANAGQFTLLFSSGPSADIPEPASVLVFSAGLLALARRRRGH